MKENQTDNKVITLIGGDRRQFAVAHALRAAGADVRVFALGESGDWRRAVSESAAVVLPLPVTKDGEHVFAPLSPDLPPSFCEIADRAGKAVLLAGKVPPLFEAYASERHVRLIDYFASESLQIRNAVLTAEGAVEIAMHELPVTLMGSKAAVVGYGRVGRTLAGTLLALKADVTCAARAERDRAWATVDGCRAVELSRFLDAPPPLDVIFNTVPFCLFDAETLAHFPAGTLLIDLASSPGGVSASDAENARVRVIRAESLPGKCAPESAGRLIADTVLSLIHKEGITF